MYEQEVRSWSKFGTTKVTYEPHFQALISWNHKVIIRNPLLKYSISYFLSTNNTKH